MGTVFYQLFYRKQMMGIRPSIVALFGLAVALAEKCCERKTVGDKSYTLVKSGGTIPSGCLNSCLYTPDDDPSINVCFGLGNETSTCIGGSCTGPDFGLGPALPPWPCPMKNTTFWGPQCRHLLYEPVPVFHWQQCGWECNSNVNCHYWTYNEEELTCTLFGEPGNPWPWGCYPMQKPNYISGEKGCPIHPYTVQDKSYDSTCRPCGHCPCCWGVCLWNWYCTDGWCPKEQGPDPSTAITVEHAQLSAAKQATEDSCSDQCGDSGTIETCYNCVAGIIKDFPIYCIKCLESILSEILKCLKNNPDEPKKALDCILNSTVPGNCTSCICDILCQIEPSLCKACYAQSQSSGGSLLSSSSKCDDSTWHYYPPGSICYKLFPEDPTLPQNLKNQWDAQRFCEEREGCLVTIDTPEKQSFIDSLLQKVYVYPSCSTNTNIEYCVWSSGNSTKSSGPWPPIATWYWNCPYPASPTPLGPFTNWGPGEPNTNGGIGGETAIMFNQPTTGVWNNFNPSGKMSFMCQKPSKD